MEFSRRVGGSVLTLALLVPACGGPKDPAGEGESCYRDADCQPGLVCIAQGNARACSRDLHGLVSEVERPPPDAGMPVDDGAAPMDDGGGVPPDPADGG